MMSFCIQLPDLQRQRDWNGSQGGRQPHAGVGGHRPRGLYWYRKSITKKKKSQPFLSLRSQTRSHLHDRKRGVGDQTQASEEADKHSVQSGWAGVPGGGFLPHHPEKAALLHHQYHHSLCALLLTLPPRLLPACQRFSVKSQKMSLKSLTYCWIQIPAQKNKMCLG